jgi:DNA-binding winged helix-turn-helix (wHTH) protein/tetratricopeptide (TPR) repeat protein
MALELKRVYQFGRFQLDTSQRLLTCAGEIVPITRKLFDTLSFLVKNSGRVLPKDEMMSSIWPDSFVGEATLAQNIFTLRKVLGESPIEAHYIETVPRLGYRFTARVVEVLPNNEQATPSETSEIDPKVKSLAILPFKILGHTEGEEYFGIGMADALITRLSNLKDIVVRPTIAVLKYDRCDYESCEAAIELGVQQVLNGIIQLMDGRIRVTVQLINVEDGAPVWAEKFDEKFSNVFDVQDTISDLVVEALTLKLTSAQRLLLRKRFTRNSQAYRYYLKGRYFWSKWNEEGLKRSIDCFERAIAVDPDYPLPYAGLADTYASMAFYDHLQPYKAMPRVKAMARKALQLDDQLAEARLPLATALFFYDWDWVAAEIEFQRSIEANPSYAIAQHSYALFLIAMRKFDEAILTLRNAMEADPVSPLINTTLGLAYYYTGNYELAMKLYRETVEEEPYFGLAHVTLADLYVQIGRYDEAIDEYKKGMQTWGEKLVLPYLGYVDALANRRGEACEIRRKLEQLYRREYISPVSLAIVCTGLGDHDDAFEWLERAHDERSNRLVFLNILPVFNSLRSDLRFTTLLRRIGLEP